MEEFNEARKTNAFLASRLQQLHARLHKTQKSAGQADALRVNDLTKKLHESQQHIQKLQEERARLIDEASRSKSVLNNELQNVETQKKQLARKQIDLQEKSKLHHITEGITCVSALDECTCHSCVRMYYNMLHLLVVLTN